MTELAPNGQPISELYQSYASQLALIMDLRRHIETLREDHKPGIASNEADLVRQRTTAILIWCELRDAIDAGLG